MSIANSKAANLKLETGNLKRSRLRRDQSGSISVASLFALLFLTMLLGMVINVGRQVDNKIKLQTAADASTYSGGVVLARGMNSLAFTNHMLCEVLALTAVMREGRDRHADPMVPDILAAWDNLIPIFSLTGFKKFDDLGPHIAHKTPLERKMVETYGDWMAASSDVVLPILEEILAEQLIPEFQREVVAATPALAQTAAARIAEAHAGNRSPSDVPRGPIVGVLWRTIAEPVGGTGEVMRGTLPAVDPTMDTSPNAAQYREQALLARNRLARHYLDLWNRELMQPFDQYAKMSQFGRLWRGFTCGQLTRLLEENANRNFPHLIRESDSLDQNAGLDQDFMFVGVAYRRKVQPTMLRLFTDSLNSDNQAFTQGMLFVPRKRPIAARWIENPPDSGWYFVKTNSPARWDLWSEDWSFQLVPATSTSVLAILQTPPQTPYAAAGALQLPNLQSITTTDIRRLTTH